MNQHTDTVQLDNRPKKGILYSAGIFIIGLIAGAVLTQSASLAIGGFSSKPVGDNATLPKNLNYESVEEVYDSLRENYDGELKEQDIMDGLKRGLAEAAGDPYTTFLSAEENAAFDSEISGTFTGIGAELLQENNVIIIATPLSGFPAEKAGVRARDIILKIDDEDATQLTVTEAVKKIRGEKGTEVKLTLLRDSEQVDVRIVRDTITIPSVSSKIENGIGYLQISRFGEDTAQLALAAANDFKAQNVKGVIVDVRNNPGGYLDQAVKVASLWMPKGSVVVEERRGDVSIRNDRAVGGNVLEGVKTVVLINGGSASASEILAGALKDSATATLLGEKTFGKGSVQELEDFNGGAALKVTIAKWYTPSGKNINKEGIEPDQKVEISKEDAAAKKDTQKDTAIQVFN